MILVDVLHEFPEFRGDILDREFRQFNDNLSVSGMVNLWYRWNTDSITVLVISLKNIRMYLQSLSILLMSFSLQKLRSSPRAPCATLCQWCRRRNWDSFPERDRRDQAIRGSRYACSQIKHHKFWAAVKLTVNRYSCGWVCPETPIPKSGKYRHHRYTIQ